MYGTNNNNVNRRDVPSNRYPQIVRGNPNDNFAGITSNTFPATQNNSGSDFFNAFRPSQPVIEKIDYTNQNDLLHNNVGDIVLSESIVEYKINIDSLDRDITVFPDPFSFTTTFNNVPSIVRSGKSKNHGKEKSYIQGDPMPVLPFDFTNVKFIKLDCAVLPNWSTIVYDEKESKYEYSTDNALVNDRFTSLCIPELRTNRILNTANYSNSRTDEITGYPINPQATFTNIFCDRTINRFSFKGYPCYSNLVYRDISLQNIRKLTLNLQNSCGAKLKFEGLLTAKQLEEAKCRGHEIPLTDIRHPLNKHNQVFYTFTIGVVEGDINNDTQFAR